MAAIVVQGGLDKLLAFFAGGTPSVPLTLKLFQSDTTPTVTTVTGDLTECGFSGYAQISLTGQWSSPSGGTQPREIVTGTLTFTHNGGVTANDVYGWYIIDGSNVLCAVERAPGVPFTMDSLDDQIDVTLTLDLANA